MEKNIELKDQHGNTFDLRDFIHDYIKENLEVRIFVNTETDYEYKYTVVKAETVLNGDVIYTTTDTFTH